MMAELSLTPAMLLDWAAFSDDWNPLHFDADVARRIGQTAPCAHGMLALMPVKQAASDLIGRDAPAGSWLHFDSLLRAPTPLASDLRLSWSRPQADQWRFTLVPAAGGSERFVQGSARLATDPPDPGIPEASVSLADPNGMVTALRDFRRCFPAVTAPWIFLESYAFGQAIRTHLPRGRLECARGVFTEATAGLGGGWTLMHVRHTVQVHSSLLCGAEDQEPPAEPFGHRLALERTYQDARQITLSLTIVLSVAGVDRMVISLGLLLRSPAALEPTLPLARAG